MDDKLLDYRYDEIKENQDRNSEQPGSWSERTDAHIFVNQQEASLEIYSILPSSPSPSSLWSNIQIKTLTGEHGGLTLIDSPPLPLFHAGEPKWALSFPLPLELLTWKTTIILSDLSPPSARDQSRLCTGETLFDARSRLVTAACDGHAACCWCAGGLIFGVLQVFGCRNSPPPVPSPAPPLSDPPCHRELTAEQWPFPACSGNWKAWWLAAGIATICESEWFGECCIRGRGGRGLCESQTASRGELLTPHRSQKAPEMALCGAKAPNEKKGDYPSVRQI